MDDNKNEVHPGSTPEIDAAHARVVKASSAYSDLHNRTASTVSSEEADEVTREHSEAVAAYRAALEARRKNKN